MTGGHLFSDNSTLPSSSSNLTVGFSLGSQAPNGVIFETEEMLICYTSFFQG